MKIDKASKQSDESILAFTKQQFELMKEVQYEDQTYLVVNFSQATIPGLPNQITAVLKSKFSKSYKTIGRVDDDVVWVTHEGVIPMTTEDKSDLYVKGIHSFAKEHGLSIF